MFVGDSVGVLRVFRLKFEKNLLQLFLLGSPFPHPFNTASAVAGIDTRSYSNTCKGQAAVVSYEDATLGVYKIGISVTPLLAAAIRPPIL